MFLSCVTLIHANVLLHILAALRNEHGQGHAGAGAAGRIAVYTVKINAYTDQGTFSAKGGDAPTKYQQGGGGTVYLQVSGTQTTGYDL